ncbi:MAG: UPF0179 family protein [archaeon GB-1867-005]|nr:UPF0179 family protein [Candidatus Culexmicrobium cathedralense]
MQGSQGLSSRKITLLSEKCARIGYKFIHEGGAEECTNCSLRKVCIENLKVGRVYEVVGVRRKSHICPLHEERVVVVEVVEAAVEAAIEKRLAVEGVIIAYYPILCQETCAFKLLCQPQGLRDGDKVKIEKLLDEINCPLNFKLLKAVLRPILS